MKKSNKAIKIMAVFLATIMLIMTFTGCEEDGKTTDSTAKSSAKTTATASLNPSGTAKPISSTNDTTATASATAKPYDPFANIRVHDSVYFGNYEQDNDASNGKEKIHWIVVEKTENKALLFSYKVLDCKQYNDTPGRTSWEFCSLRRWLNDSFYGTAFSSDEQSKILTTKISTAENPDFGTDGGEDVTDKVFLLSIDEANEYLSYDVLREVHGTEYAEANGLVPYYSDSTMPKYNGNDWSWLRSPGKDIECSSKVISYTSYNKGSLYIEYDTSAYNEKNGVRPVIWVALDDTAKGDTPIASRTPEVKPTAKPIDTTVYIEDYGDILVNATYTEFALKSTGEVYKVPDSMPTIYYWKTIDMYDKENDQILIKTYRTPDGGTGISNTDLYVFSQGNFYKVSEGTIVSMSQRTNRNIIRWVEDNGLGKSINVRSKWYNEVYIEAEGVTGVGSLGFSTKDKVVQPKAENILANVVKIS